MTGAAFERWPQPCDAASEGRQNAYERTGYRMIHSLEVHNFRCFKHVELKDCKRINIVVGKNASGKTTLLEALFLALAYNVNSVATLKQWRGFEPILFQATPSALHAAIWRDLFHDYTGSRPIRIKCKGDAAHDRELVVSPIPPTVKVEIDETQPNAMKVSGVTFKWTAKGLPDFEVTPVVTAAGLQIQMGPEAPAEVFLFAANQTYSAREFAQRFSDLSKRLRSKDFVEVFRGRYPEVEDMSVEIYAGAPMICAKVKSVDEKIPLNLLSGGINKLSSILLAFASAPKSVILIDEIENGLYYKDLPEIWGLLRDFAERFDCQIFASTHSGECIQAASEVARDHQTSFSIIQAADGRLNQFQGDKFVLASDEEIEIR